MSTFIDQWPEHVETVKRGGLRASGSQGDFTVPVKIYHLAEAIKPPRTIRHSLCRGKVLRY